MKRCSCCGCQNEEASVRCVRCGWGLGPTGPHGVIVRCFCGETYHASEQQVGQQLKCFKCLRILVVGPHQGGSSAPPLPTECHRPGLPLPLRVLVWVCGLLLVGIVGYEIRGMGRLEDQLKGERAEAQRQHEAAEKLEQASLAAKAAAEEGVQRARLQDPAFLSGAVAQQRHAEEWARRLAHKPEMAASAMEKKLLRMEQVGRDPAVAAQAALEEVAQLAAPVGSRVEVKPSGERFIVRVAFRMSAVSEQESGAVTKHHSTESMRQEIEDLCARVMKDLFSYCGSRGIEKLSVSCNHALRRPLVPSNATAQEKEQLQGRAAVSWGNLYRASLDATQAGAVPNWRRLSKGRLRGMMKVEYDGLRTLEISGAEPRSARTRDPEGELEF